LAFLRGAFSAVDLSAADFSALVFVVLAALRAPAFFVAFVAFAARFEGPRAARAASSVTASSNVISSGVRPRGTLAFVVPSVT
jgi:hypothetical protein